MSRLLVPLARDATGNLRNDSCAAERPQYLFLAAERSRLAHQSGGQRGLTDNSLIWKKKNYTNQEVGFGSERVVSVRASAADEGTTDFWFLGSDRSQLAEDAQAQL